MNRFYILPFCAYALFTGCSSDDVKSDGGGGTDGGGTKDSGGTDGSSDSGMQDTGTDGGVVQDTGLDTGVDAGLNGCPDMAFVDKSAGNQATRTIDPWNLTQTAPICWIVSQNQSVVWNANPSFAFVGGHPLGPAGGDMPNPILSTSNGTTVSFAFPNTGNYGFQCNNHPSSMRGVIRVKP